MENVIISDPVTLTASLIAVAFVGLSKGGLGGAFSLLGVPIMALFMPPLQAAALLLPIYLLMDAVSLWTWRGQWNKNILWQMVPAALVGIVIGWLTASIVSDAAVRLLVGIVALGFVAMTVIRVRYQSSKTARGNNPLAAHFWGLLSGFTSFVAHAGGPTFQIYVMPMRLTPSLYTGTSVVFFAIMNASKIIPYYALGQFDLQNFSVLIPMLPVAVIATLSGAYIVKRMKAETFYPFMYSMVAIVSIKLIFDGISAL